MSPPGKTCCVLNCTQRGISKRISYHRLPSLKNRPMRLLWLKQVRRRDYIYNPVKYIYVCSKHFKTTDYEPTRGNGSNYLRNGAVPSIFSWNFATSTKIDDSTEPTDESLNNTEVLESDIKDIVSDIIAVVASTEECLGADDCTCECSKKVKELESCIAELNLKVSLQKRAINIQNYKLKEAEKDILKAKHQAKIAEQRYYELKPSIEKLNDNNKDLLFYTGLPSYDKLMALYNRLNPGHNSENINFWNSGKVIPKTSPVTRNRKLNVKDQFLLVLMRLRLGLFLKDLADRFGISPSTASNYCITWINFMYFRLGQINIWPTREQIDATMPEGFKRDYPSTRVIIDATELKCQASKSMVLQSASYSNYKSTTTYKGLLGISPNGYVTFVSHLFTGSISDQEITRRSGFLKLKFDENDSVMADKGFLIEKMLNAKGVKLNIPPFLGEKGQFSKEELEKSQKIAALRIHVERRIARIRGFHILDRPIPLTLAPVINQLWTVIALMSNFQSPLIVNMESEQNANNSSLESDEFYQEILEPGNSTLTVHDELDDFEEEILEPDNMSVEDVNSDESGTEQEIPVIDLDSSL